MAAVFREIAFFKASRSTQPSGPDGPDAIVTSLTVKWPLPFSKTFAEKDGIEKLILPYVSVVLPRY